MDCECAIVEWQLAVFLIVSQISCYSDLQFLGWPEISDFIRSVQDLGSSAESPKVQESELERQHLDRFPFQPKILAQRLNHWFFSTSLLNPNVGVIPSFHAPLSSAEVGVPAVQGTNPLADGRR